jgi:hypothetical protein
MFEAGWPGIEGFEIIASEVAFGFVSENPFYSSIFPSGSDGSGRSESEMKT